MTSGKPPQSAKKSEGSLARSSAAEYLTFVAASGQGGVEAVFADENIWLTQKMMGVLYDVNVRTARHHRRGLQGQFRAGGAVPQMGHGHRRAVRRAAPADGCRRPIEQ